MNINFIKSIKTKIMLLICAMSLFTLALTSTVFYYFVYNISTQQAQEHIENETKLISLRFGELFRVIKNDVSMLLKTPPIQGIIRSKKNNDIDAIGKSTLTQWRERLENIFLAVMQNNENYTQIRYVGIQDNGKEIVRVNRDLRNKYTFEVVSLNDMQSKNNEPYFINALNLAKGETYISSITYNRENGQISNDYISTMRVIAPVYDGDLLFGFIIINIDYQGFFEKITNELTPSTNLLILNNDGSYFEYNYITKKYTFINTDELDRPVSDYVKYGRSLYTDYGNYADDSYYTYYVKNQVSDYYGGGVQYFFTALQVKKSDLFAKSSFLLKFIIILMMTITLVKLFIGYIVSNRLINPLTKMSHEVKNYTPASSSSLQLPVSREDEIGLLAISFKDMIDEIEQFIYAVSHDLKQPLRNISSYISFIKMDYFKLVDDTGKSYIDGLEKSIKRMNLLITELLSYSRIGYNSRHERVDLNMVLENVLLDLDSAIKSNQAVIDYSNLPVVSGNIMDLHSLFQNLLDNAIKYRQEELRPVIKVTVKETRNFYVLEFKDNGIGIESQYHNKVFELFQRVNSSNLVDSSGIGLAHCKKIVEQHHGSIKIESKKNQGCTFIISLPNINNI